MSCKIVLDMLCIQCHIIICGPKCGWGSVDVPVDRIRAITTAATLIAPSGCLGSQVLLSQGVDELILKILAED